MKRFILVWVILSLFKLYEVRSQTWIRIYGEDKTCWAQDLLEQYDKGYLLLSQVDPGPGEPQMHAWIIKSDINGIPVWDKKIYDPGYYVSCNDVETTSDGGMILIGSTTKLDPNDFDVFTIKLNSCGEKEWCNVFSTPGNSDYGNKIKQIPGGYIALVNYFQRWQDKRIWLFKLDELGNPIWQKLYAYNDTNIRNEECRDLLVTSDGGYLITGDGYYWNPPSQSYYLRPLMIKTDPDGEVQWELIYGLSSGYRGDVPTYPTETSPGIFYSSARHFRYTVPYGDSPSFIKYNDAGEELYYRDLIDSTVLGMSTTLNFINDSEMLISAGWINYSSTNELYGVIRTDTLGNVSKIKILIEDVVNTFRAAIVTQDDKYLVTGGFSVNNQDPHVYLYKLNFDLEYDTLDPTPHTYDSLCPYPIVSDTMDLNDCDIITEIHEPSLEAEFYDLHLYPNPASDKLLIELPDYLKTQSQKGNRIITTIYHQWKETRLDVFDLYGRLMFSRMIPQAQKIAGLDVSPWSPGMYVARLVLINEVVGRSTFIVAGNE